MKTLALLSLLAAVVIAPAANAATPAAEKAEKPAAEAAAAPAVEANASEVKAAELNDGTKIQIEGKKVYVLDSEGKKTPAKDGAWEAKDGSKFTTKNGVIVK